MAGLAVLAMLAGCASPPSRSTPAISVSAVPSANTATQALQLAAGYTATVYASNLLGPSALAWGPAPDPLTQGPRRLYVTQLNGAENAGTGQILALAGPNATPVVIASNLQKPTGLAWLNNSLYVVAYRSLLRLTDSDADGTLDHTETLVTDVPFNGRSLGQVDAGPDGRLYFESTGGSPANSGYLYSIKPDGTDQRIIARGLKNVYAYAFSPSGELYMTEIGDALLNPPREEINRWVADADYGWDRCPAELQTQDPSIAACKDVPKPLATFPPHASPTGLAWFADGLLVANWGPIEPQVRWLNPHTGEVKPFVSGLQYPMDVLPLDDKSVLVLDFAGTLYQITASK